MAAIGFGPFGPHGPGPWEDEDGPLPRVRVLHAFGLPELPGGGHYATQQEMAASRVGANARLAAAPGTPAARPRPAGTPFVCAHHLTTALFPVRATVLLGNTVVDQVLDDLTVFGKPNPLYYDQILDPALTPHAISEMASRAGQQDDGDAYPPPWAEDRMLPRLAVPPRLHGQGPARPGPRGPNGVHPQQALLHWENPREHTQAQAGVVAGINDRTLLARPANAGVVLAATVAIVAPPGMAVGDPLLPHGALPFPSQQHPALQPSAEGVVVFRSENWPAGLDPFTMAGAGQMAAHPPLQHVFVPTRFARQAWMPPPPQDPPDVGASAGTLRHPGTRARVGELPNPLEGACSTSPSGSVAGVQPRPTPIVPFAQRGNHWKTIQQLERAKVLRDMTAGHGIFAYAPASAAHLAAAAAISPAARATVAAQPDEDSLLGSVYAASGVDAAADSRPEAFNTGGLGHCIKHPLFALFEPGSQQPPVPPESRLSKWGVAGAVGWQLGLCMSDGTCGRRKTAFGNLSEQNFFPRPGGGNLAGPPDVFLAPIAQMFWMLGCNEVRAEFRYRHELGRYERGGFLYHSRSFFGQNAIIQPGGYFWSAFANPRAILDHLLGFIVSLRGVGSRGRRRSPEPPFWQAMVEGSFELKLMFATLWGFCFGDGCAKRNLETERVARMHFRDNAPADLPPAPVAEIGARRLRFKYVTFAQGVHQGHFRILVFMWELAQILGYRVSTVTVRYTGVTLGGRAMYCAQFSCEVCDESFEVWHE